MKFLKHITQKHLIFVSGILIVIIFSFYLSVLDKSKAAPVATVTSPFSSLPNNKAMTNGVVQKTLIGPEGETYIAGQFSYVGEGKGSSIILDKQTGEFKPFPQITGAVYAVAPDGDGGFYIGGTFSKTGSAKKINLVRILKSGMIDESFFPGPNGIVYALYFDESSKILYVGGTFTSIFKTREDRFKTERIRLAAFDTSKKWVLTNLNLNINSTVSSISFNKNTNTIYLGGTFTFVNGQKRVRLASVNVTNGILSNWSPNPNAQVLSLVVDEKSNLVYVIGNFTQIGGQKRKYMASFLPDGKVGNLDLLPNANIYSLAINPKDGTLYIGGLFTSINDKKRNHLAAINPKGELSSFNFDITTSVLALAFDEKTDVLYVGGGFGSTPPLSYVGAIDSKTNTKINSFIPNVELDPHTRTMFISANDLFISNLAVIKKGDRVYNMARLKSDGSPDGAFNISVNGMVYDMLIDSNKKILYIGGSFSSVGGEIRNNLAAIDMNTNLVIDWDPNVDGPVYSLVFDLDKNLIYIGGVFKTVGSIPRMNIAVVDMTNSFVSDWNPSALGITGGVYGMALNKTKDILYAGGFFSSLISASPTDFSLPERAYLFPIGRQGDYLFDFSTLSLEDAQPITYSCAISDSLEFSFYKCAEGTNIEQGPFSCVSPRVNFATSSVPTELEESSCSKNISNDRRYLVALNTNTGAPVSSWLPKLDGGVTSLALNEEKNLIYVAGRFASVSGQVRKYLAAIDLTTGQVLPWNPKPNNIVLDIEFDKNRNIIYAGGHFTYIGGGRRPYIAGLDANIVAAKALLWNPQANGIVYDLSLNNDGTVLNAGGYFSSMFLYTTPYFASFKTLK